MPQLKRGLVQVYTGDGKGKTTAAMGLAMRALGRGFRVCVIQFIKMGATGEQETMAAHENLEFLQMGTGFVGLGERTESTPDQGRAAAAAALAVAREKVLSGDYDLVILDEVNYALNLHLLETADVLALLADKPSHVELILTGGGAPEALLAAADLVTEMRRVKHPFERGIPARRGIEF